MTTNLRAALTRIYVERARLEPEDVVEAARAPASELHDYFEWNDSVAARRYRLHQAAALIRSVHIEFVDSGETKRVRAFSTVRSTIDPERRGYRPTEEVMADPLGSKILEREFERAIADLKRKYGHLKTFGEMVRAGLLDEVS